MPNLQLLKMAKVENRAYYMKRAKKIDEISYGVRSLRAAELWSKVEISTIEANEDMNVL